MADQNQNHAYRALFEHSNIGIIISNESGIIEQVNPFAARMFGYENQELIGQKIEILIPQKMRQRHVGLRAHYNQEPRVRIMGMGIDLLARKKDDTEFPVEISLATYETDGKKQIVSFINDITQRKKAEEDLKRLNTQLEAKVEERTKELSQALLELGHINESLKDEMEQRKKVESEVRGALEKEKELNELKSRFVSMASHEFRTPLSGIMTSAALIDRYAAPQDVEKRNKHVKTIKASVQSLANILNDFLSLDKLDQGKIKCRPAEFSLVEFCESLTLEMHELRKREQHLVYKHIGSDSVVHLDKDMLRNILINLLSNAIKYSDEGKEIAFTTEIKNAQLSLTIQDQGLGIPENDQKNLFETFFRAQNVLTIHGTGLGLNIVKRYLDLMGGSIRFVSQENTGTTFVVTLPLEHHQ